MEQVMSKEYRFIDAKFIAAHEKATQIRVIPHIFPWKWLGCTDQEFMQAEMHYSHGPLISDKQKVNLLACVRQQEEELMERHNFVAKREKVMGKQPKYVQLELF